MNPSLPAHRSGLAPRALRVGAAAALTMNFLFGSSGALAAAPPANTVIGNQASATYLDPNGASQLATSNLVQTTVLQVGSFNLDAKTTVTTDVVNTKTGAAGATVYAPHVLTNTGNGPDKFTVNVAANASTFTKVEVFADANADGLPDSTTALCSVTPATVCDVPAQTVAGGNGTFAFVVAYSIPGTATAATFPSPVPATITATAGTPALYAESKVADVDNVNLTNLAAFNATKSLSVPAVAWSGNSGTWPVASVSGPRSAPSCVATVGGASAPAAGCHYTTYTLRFNNTGGAAGRFVMTDTLPSGFTYVPGSAVWSSAPGTALADGAAGDPVGIDFGASGNILAFVVDSLPVNASQTLSFVVMVDSDAAVGTATTTNTAKYNPLAAPAGTTSTVPGTTGSSTNPASYTVVGTYGIVLGSADASAGPTASLDSSAGVPNANAADNTTVASAGAGTTVKFPQTVFNIGNATDTVNLAATLGSFPAGTTFKFFAADGLTPLIDNNSDGIADTGPIVAGSSVKIVVAATLPAPAAIPPGPFNAIVTGTSTGDATKSETTRDTLTAMLGVLVDLTNTPSGNGVSGGTGNGDVGTGPSPQPTTPQTTSAGTGTIFNLFVKNNDSAENTYSLAASQTSSFPGSLPSGWTVKFVAAGGSCSSAAITTVKVPGNGGQTAINACVTPPASQTPVSNQLIYFQVRSTTATSTGATAIDTKTDAVTVTTANTFGATLTPSNNGQVAPGGSVVYAHTLTNTGAQICEGPYTFTAALPSQDVSAGWTTALYIDVDGDGQIGSSDTLVTTGSIPGPLPAGGTQKLLVKVFAPGGASAGATDTATVTVTFPAGEKSCGSPSATDVSTVITGQMRLVKTQALDADCKGDEVPSSSAVLTAKPGECIVYRVVATNEGAAPVTNMSINDAVPAYTSLTGAVQPANQCTSSGVSGTALAFSSTASTVACGSTANTVAPGGTATLTFSVKVNN